MDSLDSIHHITIQVANLEQSIQWYTSSFTCEIVYQDKTEAILQFANTRLVLSLPSMQQRHIAFIRDDAATLGELRQKADGIMATSISDPTGNVVEIVDKSSIEPEQVSGSVKK